MRKSFPYKEAFTSLHSWKIGVVSNRNSSPLLLTIFPKPCLPGELLLVFWIEVWYISFMNRCSSFHPERRWRGLPRLASEKASQLKTRKFPLILSVLRGDLKGQVA